MQTGAELNDAREEQDEAELEDARIDGALRQAARDALLQHKRAGNAIVVFRGGQIIEVPPHEIEVPAD